ncbi:MAG: hypothetical protein LUQ32_05185 [Methanomicrobiales archaeon]|nr:hypothetical protein [Methanomicrobiales archaeon]
MTALDRRRGLILFGLILAIALVIAFTAYRVTGPLGIEERYSQAVGLPGGSEGPDGDWFGFSLEGNPLMYGGILLALGGICVIAYLRWRREKSR